MAEKKRKKETEKKVYQYETDMFGRVIETVEGNKHTFEYPDLEELERLEDEG